MEMEWPAFVALEFELSVSKQKARSTVSDGVRVRVNDNAAVCVCVCVCVMSSAAGATASNTLQVWPHIRKILEVMPRCRWQHSGLLAVRIVLYTQLTLFCELQMWGTSIEEYRLTFRALR